MKAFALVVVFILTFFTSIFFIADFVSTHNSRYLSHHETQMTNFEDAKYMASQVEHFLEVIYYCQRVPDNFKEVFEDNFYINHEHCKNFSKFINNFHNPEKLFSWLDSWGRPFVFKFFMNPLRLSIKSHGRFIWTKWDDIEESIALEDRFISSKLFERKIKYCLDSLPSDQACFLNLDWK